MGTIPVPGRHSGRRERLVIITLPWLVTGTYILRDQETGLRIRAQGIWRVGYVIDRRDGLVCGLCLLSVPQCGLPKIQDPGKARRD